MLRKPSFVVCWLLCLQPYLLLVSGFVLRESLSHTRHRLYISGRPPMPFKRTAAKHFPQLPHLPQTAEYRSPQNRAKNLQIIHDVRNLAKRSDMIIAVNLTALTADEGEQLRQSLPDNATMRTVRKRLFNMAVHDTDFEDLEEHLVGQNVYIFCNENNTVPTLRALHGFVRENPRVKRRAPIKAYSTPQTLFTKDNTTYMEKLLTREECILKLKYLVVSQQLRLLRALKMLADSTANETLSTTGLPSVNTTLDAVNITLAGVNATIPIGVDITEVHEWMNKTLDEVLQFTVDVENGNYTSYRRPRANNTNTATSTTNTIEDANTATVVNASKEVVVPKPANMLTPNTTTIARPTSAGEANETATVHVAGRSPASQRSITQDAIAETLADNTTSTTTRPATAAAAVLHSTTDPAVDQPHRSIGETDVTRTVAATPSPQTSAYNTTTTETAATAPAPANPAAATSEIARQTTTTNTESEGG